MTKLSDIPVGQTIFGVFYGGSGTGKTWIMGTAGDDTLYCDVEGRLGTLQNPLHKSRFNFNPYLIQVFEGPLPDDGAKALVSLTHQINEFLDGPDRKNITKIVVDGASAIRRFAMNAGLEINSKVGKSKSLTETKTKISAIVKDFPYSEITVADFGTEMSMVERFIYTMKECCEREKLHFFMTAHERVQFNKPDKIGDLPTVHSVKPGFTGQTFPDQIPGIFDLVWHTETKGAGERVQYFARTAGDSSLIAKTCLGKFPVMVENPNIQNIIKNIQGV